MRAGLLLIDLQEDYLRTPGLAPDAERLVAGAGELLRECRAKGIPVFHVVTTVSPDGHDRMPHWKTADRWMCVVDTPGHAPPASLTPEPNEVVVGKAHYSAFEGEKLAHALRDRNIDTLIVAGLHLHACVRASVLDAYQKGFHVWVVEDVVASDDPLHAAATVRYLADRAIRFASRGSLWSALAATSASSRAPGVDLQSPRDGSWCRRVPIGSPQQVADAADVAHRAAREWQRVPIDTRAGHLRALADALEASDTAFTEQLVLDVGKPITEAAGEVRRTVDLLRLVADTAPEVADDCVQRREGHYRRRPLGVVGMITPWNNPLAIPLGKIAPALLHGNTVLWKPAPAGAALATRFMELATRTDLPTGAISLVLGDRATARDVMSDPRVAAVTLSGSSAAGYAAQEICARRRIPLQAELGGNNAAIVWSDANVERAAREIVHGAFGFAGQRCTANRRVVIDDHAFDDVVAALIEATGALGWGDPKRPEVSVGPVVSAGKRDELNTLIAGAIDAGLLVFQHASPIGLDDGLSQSGFYVPPTILDVPDPTHPLVQEESFGPVLVLQRAGSWDDAIELANGVSQGLVAALFSASPQRQKAFLEQAQAGILKINQATHGAGVDLPFGGWKQSGVGPPEHGPGNREFYTRAQAVYVNEDEA